MPTRVQQPRSESSADAFSVPSAVMEGIASRFRASGIFILALHNDGSLAWHDSAAGMFFLRYVTPLLQYPDALPGISARDQLTRTPNAITVHRFIPGIILAAVPHTDKRQLRGAILVAARAESFQIGEDAMRICTRLGIDTIWLDQQAREHAAYNDLSLQRQARLLQSCLRDQLRLSMLECELTSVSEQLASTYEELSLIYQVSSGIRINRSATDFFKQTCNEVLQVMGLRGIGVALHPDSTRPSVPVLYGKLSLPPDSVGQLGSQLVQILQHRSAPLLINDLNVDKQFSWLREHARQLLAVPLQRYDKTLGCLFALDCDGGQFDSADAKLLTSIANESAIYLENATLFDDVHGLMMGLMHSLTSAIDAKDAYTCGHSERVALLSRHLAQQIGLSDHEVEGIYMAALLHDVGKIGVPESVLQKAGKLTSDEFEQMKKHPQIGARILQDVRQIRHLIPGVMHHHERFDGNGYPSGLSGKDIPLMGRIICLADSFDAMTSNRTYRKALPLEHALDEMRRCAGTQFDPELVEAFARTTPQGFSELLHDHQQKSKRLLDVYDMPNPKAA